MLNQKFEVLSKKDCTTELKVEIEADNVSAEMEKVFGDIRQNAVISGFRKGKAPLDMVKREFAQTALSKTLRNLMADSIEIIVKDQNLKPVAVPVAEPQNYEPGANFVFKVSVEEPPEFELKDYKKLKLTKKIKQISEKDVENVVNSLREKQAILVDAGDVTVDQTHFVVADYKNLSGPAKSQLVKEQILDLSNKQLPEGFAEGLIGARIGETRIVSSVAGKESARFEVTINAVKKKTLPAVDDEFAKDMGYENMEQLTSKINTELKDESDRRSRQQLENDIIDALLESNIFVVPPSLVKEEIDRSLEKTRQYLKQHNRFNEQEFEKSLPAMEEKYKADAEKGLRISYILSHITKLENIAVPPEEIDAKIEEFSGGNEKAKENYNQYRSYIELQLQEKKVFDFLIENAKIKEIKE